MYDGDRKYYINKIENFLKPHPTMAPHLKGVTKSTMTDQIRKELCEYKRDHSTCTQKDLQLWLEEKFHLKVSQGTISNTLKRHS